MSSGAQDILSVVAYVCDSTKGLQAYHVGLVSMGGTNSEFFKNQLERVLSSLKIEQRCVEYVYDVGSNLSQARI